MHYKGQQGLLRLRSFISSSDYAPCKEAQQGTIFGLLEEKPATWIKYKNHNGNSVFETLLRTCAVRGDDMAGFCDWPDEEKKLVLLKVELLPQDNPFVVDFIHISRMYENLKKTNAISQEQIQSQASLQYWQSRIPLQRYSGNYTLPEVIVHNHLPLERIEKVWEKTLPQYLTEVYGKTQLLK